ncbi:MAG: hypothetical protein AB7L71_03995 [Vicinamibacterales bacterium]
MLRLLYVLALGCVAWSARLGATTYPPMTFDEIVSRADVIFVGEVVDVRPMVVRSSAETVIRTRVVFRVRDALWGTSSALEIFEFLGGQVGDVRMSVAEMPQFAVGDRRVMFAYRARSINPVVGFTQGTMRIQPDATGVDRVTTLDRAPIARVEQLGRPRALAIEPAMTLRDLRGRIVRALEGRRP